MSRTGIFGTAVIAAVAMNAALASASDSSPSGSPTPPNSSPDPMNQYMAEVGPTFMANQKVLIDLKSQIISLPGIEQSGYVESVNDAATNSTVLLWKGTSPLQAEIVALAKASGIKVTIQQRKHSKADLDSATAKIQSKINDPGWGGFMISSIAGADATTDGLTLTGYFNALTTDTPALRSEVEAFAKQSAGIADVHVVYGVHLTLWSGRSTDFSPFNAGGYMYDRTNQFICSSGFGILLNGVAHTTTARHCDDGSYHSRDANGPTNQYGSSVATVALAGGRVLSGAGDALAFDGAWNTTGYTKTVVGFRDLSVNDSVCTDGGNSGIHCLVKVVNLNVSLNDGYGSFPTIKGIQQASGQIAGGVGDSGGAVVVPYTGGTTVGAAGMIQGSLGSLVPCTSMHDLTECSKEVEFSSMHTFVNALPGSSLIHG